MDRQTDIQSIQKSNKNLMTQIQQTTHTNNTHINPTHSPNYFNNNNNNNNNSISNKVNESVSDLRLLQDQLKRQYLLLQRQQREKAKIKKQIQSTIQEYYTLLVEKKGLGNVVTEDKLSNSYNFVKDLILSLSKDVRTGFQVLMLCDQGVAEELCPLLLGMFYQNFNENDPYLKKSTTFGEILASKIVQQLKQQNFLKKANQISLSLSMIKQNTRLILRQFCKLQSLRQYFQMLANRVFNKIPSSLRFAGINPRGSVYSPQSQIMSNVSITQLSQSQSIALNRSGSFSSSIQQHEIQIKIQEAVQQYKNDIISKAEMMPVSLRVLVYMIIKLLKQTQAKQDVINKFIWQIILTEYTRPFDNSNSKKWNHFKNSYFSQTVQKISRMMIQKADPKFIVKLIDKISCVNLNKINKKQQESKKKIAIHGGCVSYRDLYLLFQVIKINDKALKNFNERVSHRVNKINEMHPNFQFFKSFNNPSTSYLVFTELVYGETLQKDYLSIYTKTYENNKIKDMLKQILSDPAFHIAPYIHKIQNRFQQILDKIIQQQEKSGSGNFSLGALQYTQQFLMKIKFLTFLIKDQKIDEVKIFYQMLTECYQRQANNINLFQQNKIQLLQCLTTVSKSKRIVQSQKQAQKNVDYHLKIVKILDTMQVYLCITGPSTRPQKQKFLKSNNTAIKIQNSTKCYHQQNIIQGLKHHASTVQQAIILFTGLKQVKHTIETGKDIYNVYQSLSKIIQNIKQTCRSQLKISLKQYQYFQNSVYKVVMRQVHEILLEGKEKTAYEIQFQKILKDLSFLKPNKIRINSKENLAELQQIWEIACRYMRSLVDKKDPSQKIKLILQMIDIVKISIKKQKSQKQQKHQKHHKLSKIPLQKQKQVHIQQKQLQKQQRQSTQVIIAYCLIRARPQKILSNINFIQVFLSKNKLMSREGGALQRLKNAVNLIQTKKIIQFIMMDQKFQEELSKNQTINQFQEMKDNQKNSSLNAYI